MKKIFFLSVILISFVLNGCDKIDGPYGVSNPVIIDTGGIVVKKVLIEDYTGHTCQGCPQSHAEALRLQSVFPGQVIVLGIHSGYFAKPQITPNNSYTYDFRTQTGDDISIGFNLINSSGTTLEAYPKGIINRAANSAGKTILDWGDWETAISEQLAKPAEASLEISNSFDSGTRTVTSSVKTRAVSDITDPVSICAFIVEDSIINWQKDGTVNIEFYTHRHVLRGSLNGSWGESLGNLSAGTESNKTYSGVLPRSDIKPEQVYIYAILYNEITKEVIQVEEHKLLP